MIITVDCNSDVVTIDNEGKPSGRPIDCPIKSPVLIISMLVELFNMLNDGKAVPVTIVKIDEDNRTIVDEW